MKKFILSIALMMFASLAVAHSGNSSSTVIHACINKTSKVTRIVPVAGNCIINEIAAHWSITGPKGDKGIQGVQGTPGISITGPKGDKGEPGSVSTIESMDCASSDLEGYWVYWFENNVEVLVSVNAAGDINFIGSTIHNLGAYYVFKDTVQNTKIGTIAIDPNGISYCSAKATFSVLLSNDLIEFDAFTTLLPGQQSAIGRDFSMVKVPSRTAMQIRPDTTRSPEPTQP